MVFNITRLTVGPQLDIWEYFSYVTYTFYSSYNNLD